MYDTYDKHGVKQERTGMRDLELSRRHRLWGYNCPATDIDFVEYDNGEPVAIIEHKHGKRTPFDKTSANYRTLATLGDRAKLPVFIVRYESKPKPKPWWWWVEPVNDLAKSYLAQEKFMLEKKYVEFLYGLRGRKMPSGIFTDNGMLLELCINAEAGTSQQVPAS